MNTLNNHGFYTSYLWTSCDGNSCHSVQPQSQVVDISFSSASWLYNHFKNNLVLDLRDAVEYHHSHVLFSKNMDKEALLSLVLKSTTSSSSNNNYPLDDTCEDDAITSSLQLFTKLFSQSARNLVLISEDGFGGLSSGMKTLLLGDMGQLDKKQEETIGIIRALNWLTTKINSVPRHLHLISEGRHVRCVCAYARVCMHILDL